MKRALSFVSGLSIAASMSALPAFAESYAERTSESYRIIDGEVVEHTINSTLPGANGVLTIQAEPHASPEAILMDDMVEVTVEDDEEDDAVVIELDDEEEEDAEETEDADDDEDSDAPLLTSEHAAVLQAAFDRASAAQTIEELQSVMTDIVNTLNTIHAQQ